jgi:hypothetical protein
VATETHPKVCVILGAGASYDVHDLGSSVLDAGLRPPLARDLFNLDLRDKFRPVLAEYEGAIVLAQRLATKSSHPDFDIEEELRRTAEHSSGLVREHYKHVPPYLRDLLTRCSYGYTSSPSCYVQLVRALLAEEPSDVLFLVLNYDDLLEQALYRFSDGAIRFGSLDDYVRADRPAKVIKLHGSINWFKAIGPLNDDWRAQVRRSDVLAKAPGTFHVVTTNGRTNASFTYQREVSGQRVYPVLTAPLAGKGPTAIV